MRALLTTFLALLLGAAPALSAEPVRVVVIGTVHLSNPSRDRLNVAVDDVLSEKRQAELAAINAAIAAFAPTQIAVEWPADLVAERFPKYLAGTLEPSRNEVVQIGFRLAQILGLKTVHGIDVDGAYPFEPVEVYARTHGQSAIVEAAMAQLAADVAQTQQIIDTQSLGALLRWLNEPARIAADHSFYRTLLKVGGGDDQPGALLLAAWQQRNLLICARLIQLAQPGDRVVAIFGAGHAHLLRQCVSETPGFELVEATNILP
jgi:hypothetical protein